MEGKRGKSASMCRASKLRFKVNLADAASPSEICFWWNDPQHVHHSWKLKGFLKVSSAYHITTLVLVFECFWSIPRGCVLVEIQYPNINGTVSCDWLSSVRIFVSFTLSWTTVIVATASCWFVYFVPFAAWVYIVADCETAKTDGYPIMPSRFGTWIWTWQLW